MVGDRQRGRSGAARTRGQERSAGAPRRAAQGGVAAGTQGAREQSLEKGLCTDPGVYLLALRRAARTWRGEV